MRTMGLAGELLKIFLKSGVAIGGVHAGNGIVNKWKANREENRRKRLEKEKEEEEEKKEEVEENDF